MVLIQEDRFLLIPFSAASPRQGQGDPLSPTPHPVKAQIDFFSIGGEGGNKASSKGTYWFFFRLVVIRRIQIRRLGKAVSFCLY